MYDQELIKEFLYNMLEDEDLEDFFERFDVTPDDALFACIQNGLIDIEEIYHTMRYKND